MEKLAQLRHEAGHTQRSLAEKVGVSAITVYRWEKGRQLPSIEDARRIAEVLGCSVDGLFGDPPAPRQRRRSRDGGAKAA